MKFFNKPEYRKFHIEPRYWNPEKEKREERIRRAKAELGIKDKNEAYIPNIKGRMKSDLRYKLDKTRIGRRKSNLRFLIILILLLVITYLYLFGWKNFF